MTLVNAFAWQRKPQTKCEDNLPWGARKYFSNDMPDKWLILRL